MPSSPIRIPPNTPAAATIEPTDRSMPAVAITNVMPIASTPTTLACVSMLRTLSQVGNVSGFEDRAGDEQQRRRRAASAYSWSSSAFSRSANAGPAGVGGSLAHTTSSARSGASVGATAWRSSSCSVAAFAVDLGDDLALAHDEDAGADADELLELGRDDEDAQARLREVGDEPVDLGLRRDVDAARGLVEQQHAALVQQPAREHDLLLVAAREQAHDAVGVVGHRVERPAAACAPRRAPSRTSSSPTREAAEVGDGSRSSSGSSRGRAPATCGPRARGRARAGSRARAAGAQPLALDEDLARPPGWSRP